MIPSEQELDAWIELLKKGQAKTEMMPRFIEGYRMLLAIAREARPELDLPPAPEKPAQGELF